MQTEYINPRPTVTFADLRIGHIFSTDEEGLFIKMANTTAIVVIPLDSKSAVPAGQETTWGYSDRVFPVAKLTIELE